MRITTPYFNLFSASLTQAVQLGLTKELAKKLAELKIKTPFQENTIPTGLRWNMHKEFGFPRTPFNVYRRAGTYKSVTILASTQLTINGTYNQGFSQGEMYVISVNISLSAGQSCTIQPYDREGKPIPYKIVPVTASGQVIIKCPFMNGITITGSGLLNAIFGALQAEVVNAKDWELIQIVGLPFNKGKIGGLGYNGTPQGYVDSLTDAETATLQRLAVGALLHLPMPDTADVNIPTPLWRAPNPADYLGYLFNAPDSLLKMIANCLEDSNDYSFSPAQRQAAYTVKKIITGVHQAGSGPGKDATVNIPVVGTTLMAATTDNYAALGLGFGTTDFPVRKGATLSTARASAAATNPFLGFDYMVTAAYTIRPFEMIELPFLDDLSKQIEFAALSCELPMPVAPASLALVPIQKNRPASLDKKATESIKLRWPKPATPQGYGVISSYKNGSSNVLNTRHTFQKDTYQTFCSFVPRDVSVTGDYTVDTGDADKFVLSEPNEPLPLYGSALHSYLAAGLDVFGRWSGYRRLNYNATAIDKQNTGVLKTTLTNKIAAPPAGDPTVVCTLEVEFSWRWGDRSPNKIELAGQFYSPIVGGPTPVQLTAPVRFAKHGLNPPNPIITITFDSAGNPTASQGTIAIVPTPTGTPAELKKYRLIVDNMNAVFPGATPWKAGYALFVRALEKVRVPINDFSAWSNAYTCQLADPRKPDVVYIPADVHYTALPDAAKIARGVLTWTAAAGAHMYHVWEASESAIRTAIDQPLKTTFPGDPTKHLKPITASLQERANQLRDILTNAGGSYTAIIPLCDKFFNKITKDPLSQPTMELAIPGSSKVMNLYRISSVNPANIESDKSGVVFFAVPQIVKPLAPRIELKKIKEKVSDAIINYYIDVHVLHGDYVPQENGTIALSKVKGSGFKLYKIRKQMVLNDIGAKGLPYKLPAAAEWQDCDVQMLNGDVYKGRKIRETITPSWKPYCYQAVSLGKADANYGEVSGESDGSVTETIFVYPEGKPQLIFTGETGNGWSRRFTFNTDAPFFLTGGKAGKLEIHEFDTTSNKLNLLKSWAMTDIAESNVDHNLPPIPAMVASLPVTNHRPIDAGGITRFSVVVRRFTTGTTPWKGVIRLYDPLGRFSDFQI